MGKRSLKETSAASEHRKSREKTERERDNSPFHYSNTENPLIPQICSSLERTSGHENHKNNEKDDEDQEDLDEQPAVVGHRLEIFEYLCVRKVHVQLSVLYISINSVREERRKKDQFLNTV